MPQVLFVQHRAHDVLALGDELAIAQDLVICNILQFTEHYADLRVYSVSCGRDFEITFRKFGIRTAQNLNCEARSGRVQLPLTHSETSGGPGRTHRNSRLIQAGSQCSFIDSREVGA